MTAADLPGLWRARLTAAPATPFLTFYDDRTGERTELSAATLDNWVAKTANLLRDGLGVAPGDRVAVGLPAHWQTAAVLLGAWAAGAVVAVVPAPAGPLAVSVAAEDDPERAQHAVGTHPADEVVLLALRPLATRLRAVTPGVTDYAAEVAAYADRFDGAGPGSAAPALESSSGGASHGELVAAAEGWAAQPGADRPRVLSTLGLVPDVDGPAGLLAGLLGPAAAGGSVVLCAGADASALAGRAAAERVTATAGVDLAGLPRLDRRT